MERPSSTNKSPKKLANRKSKNVSGSNLEKLNTTNTQKEKASEPAKFKRSSSSSGLQTYVDHLMKKQ